MAQLECKNLTLGYESDPIIRDLSFTVNQGDYLCIEGENGAGKSTLLKALLGLKRPTSGEVIYNDLARGEIGYLPQQTIVQRDFPASVAEVVLSGFAGGLHTRFFYTREEHEMARLALARLSMEDYAHRCYRDLSGGQQQRVLLARAICGAKKILVLDEPVAGLDPTASATMYEIINQLNRKEGITILMVSHDVQVATEFATHVLRISREGYTLADGARCHCMDGHVNRVNRLGEDMMRSLQKGGELND